MRAYQEIKEPVNNEEKLFWKVFVNDNPDKIMFPNRTTNNFPVLRISIKSPLKSIFESERSYLEKMISKGIIYSLKNNPNNIIVNYKSHSLYLNRMDNRLAQNSSNSHDRKTEFYSYSGVWERGLHSSLEIIPYKNPHFLQVIESYEQD